MVLLEIVLPVFLIFLSGYWIQKKFNLDIKTASALSLYILCPVLIFRTFYTYKLNEQFYYIILVQLLLLFSLIAITKLLCRVFHYDLVNENALILTTAFMNSGNYGAPIILFAFGDKGFNEAILIMVLHALFMGVFGVYFASRGKGSVKESLINIFRLPNVYAVALGLIFQYTHIPISHSFQQAIDLVGEASIPVIMLVLGMQLATIQLKDLEGKLVTVGTSVRLVISPAVAWVMCSLLPIDQLLKHVMVVIAAMPSAATALLYAVQFEAKPQLVSSVTFVSTLLSFVTISVLIGLWVYP